MRVKNISARVHHVGNVTIVPGETKEIPKGFENAINKADLIEVKEEDKGEDKGDEGEGSEGSGDLVTKTTRTSKK
jgi:hypothetical protein